PTQEEDASSSDGYRIIADPFLGTGLRAAPMGDANGDALADFALGGFGRPFLLVLGKTDNDPFHCHRSREGTVDGATIMPDGEAFGWGFSGGGDIDGDGWPDLVIGRPFWFEEPAWGFVYGF